MAPVFHDVRFPVSIARGARIVPTRRTEIVTLGSGVEERNTRWAHSRRRIDVGTGIKSLADLYTVLSFFEERRGRLHAFRFTDPIDHASAGPGLAITANDQLLGTGDGETTAFQLVKAYGSASTAYRRTITKPVEGSLLLALDGVATPATLDAQSGVVTLASAPPTGVVVTAGFLFDIPVRFDTDALETDLSAFAAGSLPSIPLLEVL